MLYSSSVCAGRFWESSHALGRIEGADIDYTSWAASVSTLDKFRLDEKVAIVTGAAGLLGSEFSQALSSAGASVIAADIEQGGAERVAEDLREHGLEVESALLDVRDPESVASLMEGIRDRFGKIDILVNSAAIDPKFEPDRAKEQSNSFETYPLEAWRAALEVNLTGMFLITQAVAGLMSETARGSIINICSTYGLAGPDQRIYQQPGEPARYKPVYYSTTKAGVLGFTRYLAAYYHGTEIRVNALTPGGVYNEHDDAFVKAYSSRTILGRMAQKDEMNGALLFLASDASSYMTGANLVVDGGWTAW